MKRRVWRRRLLILSGVAVGLLILIWQVLPMAAAPYVRAKLRAMIAEQLNAELTMGRLAYHFPYGVSVSDARLVATDPQGEAVNLISADRIELRLAQHPFHAGPLVIERLEIDAPAARIVRTSQGIVGRGLTAKDAQPDSVRREKLSEMFELRKVRLSGGSIVYEDRVSPGAVPLVWRDLALDLTTQPQSSGEYAYQFTAGDGKVASVSSEGSLNIDTLLLRLTKCDLHAAVDPKAQDSPLPGEVQELLRAFAIAGEVAVNVVGEVPLAEPSKATVTTTIALSKATARLKDAVAPLDELSLRLSCAFTPEPRLARVTIDQLLARGGDVVIRGDGGEVALNMNTSAFGVDGLTFSIDAGSADRTCLPAQFRQALDQQKLTGALTCTIAGSAALGGWRDMLECAVADVVITPRDLTLQPPELPDTLHDVGEMTLRLANGTLTAKSLRARYGNDIVFVREAKVPLKHLPAVADIEQLAGAITFDYPHAKYPPHIARYLEQVRPKGPFFFDATARLDFAKPDPLETYQVRVNTERAGLSTMWHHVPLTNVTSDLLITPTCIDITRFNADVLTGKLATSGRIDLGDVPTYAGRVRLRRVDLNRLAEFFVEPGEPPITVSGEISSDFAISGKGFDADQALDALQADGALEVANGDLFHVPVLADIAERVRLGSAGRVGEAATAFKLANRRIQLIDAAVGAPAVGVRGGGHIAFDGSLDLDLIATQFNDWEKHIRRDDNPVANVAGAIAGTVQRGLNTVTKELLYRMKVVGTVEQPDVRVIAAPALQR